MAFTMAAWMARSGHGARADEDMASRIPPARGGLGPPPLSLALIEEGDGRATALAVAQELVVLLKRLGGQSQFCQALAAQEATRPALRELQTWITGNAARASEFGSAEVLRRAFHRHTRGRGTGSRTGPTASSAVILSKGGTAARMG